jgi:hypothetical protein
VTGPRLDDSREVLEAVMETFSVSTCPVCNNWCIEDHLDTPLDELEAFMREHIYECFGVTEIMTDLPWSA